MLDKWQPRATEIQKKFRAARAAILSDKALTDLGKRQRLDALENQRQGEVTLLKNEAEVQLTRTRGALEVQRKWEGEKHLEARRKVLGDVILADIYRRQLEVLTTADIAYAYQNAPTEWEKEVIAGYGQPLLQLRANEARTPEARMDVNVAMEALNQAEPETIRKATGEMREVDSTLGRLDELDVETYNNHLADRLGVNAAFMDAE